MLPGDPSRKVLDQRGYRFANQIYDKSALTTEPMRWSPGFHHCDDLRMRPDLDLYLIHLDRMDCEICLTRHATARVGFGTDATSSWAGPVGSPTRRSSPAGSTRRATWSGSTS